jgi:hypothetical protein
MYLVDRYFFALNENSPNFIEKKLDGRCILTAIILKEER